MATVVLYGTPTHINILALPLAPPWLLSDTPTHIPMAAGASSYLTALPMATGAPSALHMATAGAFPFSATLPFTGLFSVVSPVVMSALISHRKPWTSSEQCELHIAASSPVHVMSS